MYVRRVYWAAAAACVRLAAPAFAQSTEPQTHQHAPAPAAVSSWRLMQDGVIYGLFNHQGGPRGGGPEFVVPNWWMGVWSKERGADQFGVNAMLSLDPATVGAYGYGEIFQVGETFDGKPLIDRQHPHDLLMQLAGTWRRTHKSVGLMITGAIAGEPTLGPVAFMHRASAANLPQAPLGHHTFDSTHISFGVVTLGIERGRWIVEGSVFNGREPDEKRWDVDLGALDSVAGRVWFKPGTEWAFQISTGKLREPEELIAGDAVRTTASGSWFRQDSDGFRAVTVGYGVNSAHGERRHGAFGEVTIEKARNAVSARVERQQVESELLISGLQHLDDHHHDHGAEIPHTAPVTALTLAAARRVITWKRFEGALGATATFYHVPDVLRPTHGARPVSYQLFFRVRLPAGEMGRMWNMVMSQGHKHKH